MLKICWPVSSCWVLKYLHSYYKRNLVVWYTFHRSIWVFRCLQNLAQLWNPISFPFEAKWPGSVSFACFTFVHLTVHDSWWKYFQTAFRFWQWINCHLFPLKGSHVDDKLSWTQLNSIYHPHDFLLRGTGDSWFIVKSEMWFGSIPSECGCFRFMIV